VTAVYFLPLGGIAHYLEDGNILAVIALVVGFSFLSMVLRHASNEPKYRPPATPADAAPPKAVGSFADSARPTERTSSALDDTALIDFVRRVHFQSFLAGTACPYPAICPQCEYERTYGEPETTELASVSSRMVPPGGEFRGLGQSSDPVPDRHSMLRNPRPLRRRRRRVGPQHRDS
jgi:hypothetical protein